MQRKTCHGCGLEAADPCPKEHTPADESLEPCQTCIRNPQFRRRSIKEALESFTLNLLKDQWNECWTVSSDGKPFIET